MAHDRNSFINYRPINKGQVVFLGDDTSHEVIGVGDASIILNNGQKKTIPNVLYIPGLMKKLFSVKKLEEVGGQMNIKSGLYTLKAPSRAIIAT